MIFKCKKFEISDAHSGLKIGTDGMLLGSWAKLNDSKKILDVGTGSGLVALMLTQRFADIQVVGLDLYEGAIRDARENFANSPWQKRLTPVLGDFIKADLSNFEILVSNPPFYNNSMPSAKKEVSLAKNIQGFAPIDLLKYAEKYKNLKSVQMIVPSIMAKEIAEQAEEYQWFLSRKCEIRPFQNAAPNRTLMDFRRTLSEPLIIEELFIRKSKENPSYSIEYQKWLKEFLIIF